MLKIRLKRTGRKHDPSYKVIVTEKGRAPQTGAYKEALGTYDARSDEYDLNDDRIQYWLDEGAQPSETVHNLLAKAGIIDDETVNPLPNKIPVEASKKEGEEGEGSDETDGQEDADNQTEESADAADGNEDGPEGDEDDTDEE